MDDWRKNLHSRASHLLSSGHLSDVSVYVGEDATEFLAHRLLLSSVSPVFEREFKNVNQAQLKIRIKDVTPEVFQKLLRYIYTDHIEFNDVIEAQGLYLAAKKFELLHLMKLCSKYISERHVSPDRACKMYETSLELNLPDVTKICKNVFITHTRDVLNSPQFLDSKIETIQGIIESEFLNIDSEMDVIEAVMKWGSASCRLTNQTDLRSAILPLLLHLRFLALTWEQFQEFLRKYEVLSGQEASAITVRLLEPNRAIPLPETICPISRARQKLNIPQEMLNSFSNQSSVAGACSTLVDIEVPVNAKLSQNNKPHNQALEDILMKNSECNNVLTRSGQRNVEIVNKSVYSMSSLTFGAEIPMVQTPGSALFKNQVEDQPLSRVSSTSLVADGIIQETSAENSLIKIGPQKDDSDAEDDESSSSDSDEEFSSISGMELRSCEIALDSETCIPDGARISDVSSDADIEVSSGNLKLIALEVQLKSPGMSESSVIVRITDGKVTHESRHDVAKSNHVLFLEHMQLQRNFKAHIQVMAQGIQLQHCPLGTIQKISVTDNDLRFSVKTYGNQKLMENKIPYIIKRIIYEVVTGEDRVINI